MADSEGALLRGLGGDWQIEPFAIDGPGEREVVVEWRAAGLCHSDEHTRRGDLTDASGQAKYRYPLLGGHEGAGVVVAAGSGVRNLSEGDHVAACFTAPCGDCHFCASGRQYLCATTKSYGRPGQLTDQAVRHHDQHGADLHVMSKLGTFSRRSVVAEQSLVQVDPAVPFAAAALVSCGVATGWGAAADRAGTVPGDVVVVVGTGGLGVSALQAARACGAVAIVGVDPLPDRRAVASTFGATAVAGSLAEAKDLVAEQTGGRMADRVIVTVGGVGSDLLADALELTARGGVCVLAGLGRYGRQPVQLDLADLVTANKEVRGSMFGSVNPRQAIPRLLELYAAGRLDLDGMTTTYPLDAINQGYADMLSGASIRSVLVLGEQ